MAQHYSVFLSYRHKPYDAALTRRVFNILEAYRLPASLRRQGYKGVERVFRDTEELPLSRQLTGTIQAALGNADCLVVVCSPDTPSSEWVDREVATFIELGRAERVYPLLIAGDAESSFPPSLKRIPELDGRVMDVRRGAKSLSPRAPGQLLKVIAAVAGCPQGELQRAHKLRRAAAGARLAAASVAVAAAVTVAAAVYWLRADSSRAAALAQQQRSMAVLSQMTYELPNKLVEQPGTYAAVAQILEENAGQITRILELARDKRGIAAQIAANYEKYATASARLGNYAAAEDSQRRAIALYGEDADKGVEGASAALASGHNNMGVLLNAQGKYAAAAEEYTQAAELIKPLCGDDPSLRSALAVYLGNSGANAMGAGDYASAVPALQESIALLDGEGGAALDRARFNLGVSLMSTGDYAGAEEQLTAAAESYGAAYAAAQTRSALKPYAQSLTQLALCLSAQAKLSQAREIFPRAIELSEELASGGDDAAALGLLGSAYNNYGLCLNMSGDYTSAADWYLKYATLLEALYADTGTDLDRANLARAYYNIAENAFKLGDYALTRQYFDMCLREYSPASNTLGDYHEAEYLARLCYYDIIVARDYTAALAAADRASQLQPDSSFVQINRMYALMYAGQYDACDALAGELASRSQGEGVNIARDLAAFTAAGLENPHMEAVLALFD